MAMIELLSFGAVMTEEPYEAGWGKAVFSSRQRDVYACPHNDNIN